MMDPTLTGSLVGAVVATTAAVLSFLAARRSHAHAELVDLRDRLDSAEKNNRLLWAYTRQLVDHIYKRSPPPPPPPDDDLRHLFS